MSTDLSKLDVVERKELRRLEAVIEKGVRTFIEVGSALKQVRDGKLYRESHKTFERYITDKWAIKKSYAYDLIASYEVTETVRNCGQNDPPKSESQARELGKAPADQQAEIWQDVCENVEEPTARDVKEAVDRHLGDVGYDNSEEYEDVEPPEPQPASPKPAKLTYIDKALASAEVGNGILASIRAAIKLVKAVDEEPGTEMLVARQKSIIRELESARDSVSVTIPKGACPRCGGKKCAQCGNQGWVNSILLKELEA